jgi:urea transport system permease protein
MTKAPVTSKIKSPLLIGMAVILVVVMPILNATGYIEDFTLNLWGKYLCYGILAISIDLLWGYTGLLCLGQALFFTLGGYMMGMHLMLMIGKLGAYNSDLPDFMVFLGHTKLPGFWEPFYSFPFAMLMVFLLPGLLALGFGFLAFRSRIKGVYFSILTQALTYGAALLFFRNDLLMGGNNGFTDFRSVLGANLREPSTQRILYILTALLLVGVIWGCKWLTNSRFGLIQRAIRDSENRVLFSGYATANFKLFIFVISAMIAAAAGALYVPQVGIINPSEMTPEKSLEAVVWVALGGRGTLVGPVIGAVSVNALKSWATRAYPDLWILILGGSFVLVVMFMPKGIVGIPGQIQGLLKRFRKKQSRDDAPLVKAESEPAEP